MQYFKIYIKTYKFKVYTEFIANISHFKNFKRIIQSPLHKTTNNNIQFMRLSICFFNITSIVVAKSHLWS